MKEMEITKDNFREVDKLYRNVVGKMLLFFVSYYKYRFSFAGKYKDIEIYVSYGGNAEAIYKFGFGVDDRIVLPRTLEELLDEYNYVSIRNKKNDIEYIKYWLP
jgi:hypothetical protein